MMDEWDRERRPKVKGALGGYMYKLDDGSLMGVAIFQRKEDYGRDAQDPEQDAFYRRWRELMEADPEWNDGEVIGAGAPSRKTPVGATGLSPLQREGRGPLASTTSGARSVLLARC